MDGEEKSAGRKLDAQGLVGWRFRKVPCGRPLDSNRMGEHDASNIIKLCWGMVSGISSPPPVFLRSSLCAIDPLNEQDVPSPKHG